MALLDWLLRPEKYREDKRREQKVEAQKETKE